MLLFQIFHQKMRNMFLGKFFSFWRHFVILSFLQFVFPPANLYIMSLENNIRENSYHAISWHWK